MSHVRALRGSVVTYFLMVFALSSLLVLPFISGGFSVPGVAREAMEPDGVNATLVVLGGFMQLANNL